MIIMLQQTATGEVNMWDQIDDFNWIKAGTSPNWNVLKSGDAGALEPDTLSALLERKASEQDLESILHSIKAYQAQRR